MNYEENFQKRYDQLNPEQKKAVDSIEGPLLVIAGPGSGKTELLSIRTANILRKTDTPPSSILCLTFTENAAENMRERLAGLIGPDAYKVAINTFHGFGTEIINKNPEYFYNDSIFKAADDLARAEIIEEILENRDHKSRLKTHSKERGYAFMNSITQCIEEFKKAGIKPDQFRKILKCNNEFLEKSKSIIAEFFGERVTKSMVAKIPSIIEELKNIECEYPQIPNQKSIKETIIESIEDAHNEVIESEKNTPISAWKTKYTEKNDKKEQELKELRRMDNLIELAEIYKEYQKKLQQKGYFDFADMILDTLSALEEYDALRYNIQEKYLYIMIDEFQDTNGVQMGLLDKILDSEINEGRPNIMAVGDDDQSIYKFQGANIENILGFHKKYREPEIVILNKNYRSTQDILDLLRKMIIIGNDRLENRIPEMTKDLIAAREMPTGEIIEKEFATDFQEMLWVAKTIKEKLTNKECEANEIAIITRKHKDLENIAKVMDYFDIPVAYKKKNNILEKKHITEIITIMRFIDTIIQKDEEAADEYMPEILSYSFWEIERKKIWEISLRARKEKKLWLEIMLESEDEKIKTLADFLIKLGVEARELTGEEIIDLITGSTEMEEYRSPYKKFYFSNEKFKENQHKYITLLSDLTALVSAVRKYKGHELLYTKDIVNFIELHEKHNLAINNEMRINDEANSVNLHTAHSAKGLEFENVFVISSSEKNWKKGGNQRRITLPANLPLSPEKDNDDDGLRLFYVALSRAKRNLYISYSGTKLRFLEEVKDIVQTDKSEEPYIEEEEQKNLMEFEMQIQNYRPQNIDEENILKGELKNYKLSVTHLHSFIDFVHSGPQKFLERNLLRFPEKASKHSSYGTAIHDSLEEFYMEYKQTKTLPSLDRLLVIFKKQLIGRRMNKKDFAEQLKKGEDHLEIYYNERSKVFRYTDEIEVDFVSQGVIIGNAQITGKIDKMRRNKETGEIFVYDYKTGRPAKYWKSSKDSQNIKLEKYKQQLIFYKILIENSRDFSGKYKVHKGFLEFIEPNRDNGIELLELEILDEDVKKMELLIKAVYNKIMNLDFPDTSRYKETSKGIKEFMNDLIEGNI